MARIQPGLERVAALLKGVDFPWKSVHVAGTNGKGSICHYASSILAARSLRVGKFTSPHLVHIWDCIAISGKPVSPSKFRRVEQFILETNKRDRIGASPFEILTATAFTIFNDANVHVGVIEVGMGGKLDATNVLNNQAVSVISKVAHDHQDFLGTTLPEIAAHKAGILRPNIPYIVAPANQANVEAVIQDYAREIGAGPQLNTSSFDLDAALYDTPRWARVTHGWLPFQLENLKVAMTAAMQVLETTDNYTRPTKLAKVLMYSGSKHHPGRQEVVRVTPVFRFARDPRNHVLVDGAHNPDAASALDSVVHSTLRHGTSPANRRPKSGWPVTWVIAMTEGKDARSYLATLLKPGDNVVTTAFGPVYGMPWVKPMDPKELLQVARSVEPKITGVHVPLIGALRALCTAKYLSHQVEAWSPIVLTGSLYLVGDLHRELGPRADKTWWTATDPVTAADRESFMSIQAEERKRADSAMKLAKESSVSKPEDAEIDEQTRLQEELDNVNREVEVLEISEKHFTEETPEALSMLDNEQALSAAERLRHDDQQFTELHATPEQLAAQIVRAEKIEEALARHEGKIEAAAKARVERLAELARRKERMEERRARKQEKKQLERQQKVINAGKVRHKGVSEIKARSLDTDTDYRDAFSESDSAKSRFGEFPAFKRVIVDSSKPEDDVGAEPRRTLYQPEVRKSDQGDRRPSPPQRGPTRS